MSSSDFGNSETGLQYSSAESSEDFENEIIQQKKNHKKACKKRKHMKRVVSDGDTSSETEGTEQVTQASKKRRKENSDQTPDHNKLKRKMHISSSDETEERSSKTGSGLTGSISSGAETERRESPVDGNRLTGSISSGAETETRESPVIGNRALDRKAEESDSNDDSSTSQDKPVKTEKRKENGSKKQEITESKEESLSASCKPFRSPKEKSGSKQKTVLHFSVSSDGTSDSDEKNKSLSPRKKSQSDGNKSSENFTLHSASETSETEEMKSKSQKEKTVEEESSSSYDMTLSKYLNNKQTPTKKNAEHASSDSSDGDSDADEEKRSLSPKKKSQSDTDSSSGSSTPRNIVDKKGKRRFDQKKGKNKTKKDPGNVGKTATKIEKLKKYIRVAGLRVRSYHNLWEGCKTDKAKVEKLLQMLNDAGLKGRPTLQKCRRLQAKRERKEEVASLDLGNIIVASQSGRPKRNARSLYVSRHVTHAEENSSKRKSDHTFSRIKNIVDSEESE